MRVTYVTRAGGRKINEDYIGEGRKNKILCVVVCDGLGGHNSGEIASRTVVTTILKEFERAPEFSKEALTRYIKKANIAVMDMSVHDPECFGMASTAAVLLIKGNRALWANIGDTRLYRLEKDRIAEVTEDHSIAFERFMHGDIEYGDIRKSSDQNKLTSAIGTEDMRINISEERFIDKDTSFLICTDGWWEYVDEDELEYATGECQSVRKRLERMISVREENAPSNSDNYTAAIVAGI